MTDHAQAKSPVTPTTIAAGAARSLFVSYASLDEEAAQDVCLALETAGFPCWMAPRNVPPGALYADAIIRAINDAQTLVLLLSASAVVSAHVGKEVERAASKKKKIIVFRIDTAALSPALEYFLSESQWIDAAKLGMPEALAKLAEAVGWVSDSPVPTKALMHRGGGALKRTVTFAVILAFAASTAAVLGLRLWSLNHRTVHAVAAITDKSIAVLPFADMSEKKDHEYFADGMAEEILNLLAKIPTLRVIGRTSSFHFKGKNEDLRTIGNALNAAYVVEGSVRKFGDRVRVTAQLINAQSGIHLWSETYDRPIGDVLKLQDEIAASLVRALQLTVEADVLQPRPSLRNTDAYNFYLQGLYARNRYDREGFDAATHYFQQSLNLDPSFSQAAASLGVTYALQGDFGYSASAAVWQQARLAADAAVKLDPTLTAPHTTLSMVYCLRLGLDLRRGGIEASAEVGAA
jgi:TolB-like protein